MLRRMLRLSTTVLAALLLAGSAPAQEPLGAVAMLEPDLLLRGSGENVDTIGIWEAPNPEDTLMIVSAKDNQLAEVWKFPFKDNEQKPLKHEAFTNGAVNGVAIDQDTDTLYLTVGDDVASGFAFTLPSLELKFTFLNKSRDLYGEPNCGLLHRPGEPTLLYVTSDNAISIHNAETGEQLKIVDQPTDVETVYPDAYYQCVYVPDENDRAGVNVYTPMLEPFEKNGTNNFGDGHFQDDAEGIWVYYLAGHGQEDDGRGYIIVSDQREPLTDYEFFDRKTWAHLGTLRLEDVGNTDGIASTQRPLPGFPLGFFAAIHDDQATAIIGWDKVLKAMGLPATIDEADAATE